MQSDRELIRQYLNGDEEAFAIFYQRYRKTLYVYLLSIVRFRETAEELLQDTFFSFLRNLARLREADAVKPYLFRTARSRAVDFFRKERRDARALEHRKADPMLKRREETGFSAEASVLPEDLEAQLDSLPDEQREVVVLRVLAGFTFPEIARLTGVSENTAVSRLRYGLSKMRTALQAGGCNG